MVKIVKIAKFVTKKHDRISTAFNHVYCTFLSGISLSSAKLFPFPGPASFCQLTQERDPLHTGLLLLGATQF